ncbi:MAG: hypothetical protein ACKV2Q_24760 [Planctomycetaceae bacterium]
MRWLLLCLCLLCVSSASAADQSRAPNCVRATLTSPGYWGWGPAYRRPDGYWYQDWTYFPGKTRSGYFCDKSCDRYTINDESDDSDEEESPPPPPKKKPKPKPPCLCGCAKSKPSISSREIEVVNGEFIETHPRARFR